MGGCVVPLVRSAVAFVRPAFVGRGQALGTALGAQAGLLLLRPPTNCRLKRRRQGSIRRGGGGAGSGSQKFVYQKWPDNVFPVVNCVFSHDFFTHFGRGGGG